MRTTIAWLLTVGLLAVACVNDPEAGGTTTASGAGPTAGATTTTDPNELYRDFVECDPLPESIPFEPVEGMATLDGVAVTDVSETGPITSVTGLVDQTPVDIRDAFVDRDDVELVYLEDEGYEAEILLDTGDWRTFIKATIRCRTGSVIAFIVAPDEESQALPVPGQQGG